MTLHRLGPFTLDTRTLLLLREDEIVRIPMKTVEVLLVLVTRRGEIVTKDELLKAAWPDSIVEEANLTVHVALLRKTLGEAAPIETVPKRGYRMLSEIRTDHPDDPAQEEARRLVLRGRYLWNKFNRASLERAASSFEAALALRPEAGEARAGLCDTFLLQGLFGFRLDRGVFTEARLQGEKAVELNPGSADAQASLAFSLIFDRFDFQTAETALERALALAPLRAEPHLWSALFHALRGETLRAMAAARKASALDPISLKAVVGSGFHLYLSQQHEPDPEPLQLALELEPELAIAHWALGLAWDRLGDFPRAEAAHRAAALFSGSSPTMESNLARSLALAGRRSEARDLADRLAAQGLAPYRLAAIEVALKENERAVAALGRAWESKDPWLALLKVDPMLDPVRNDPRVQAIQKGVLIG